MKNKILTPARLAAALLAALLALFVFTGCPGLIDNLSGDDDGGSKVAAPVADPGARAMAPGAVVRLSTATEGAAIYYTLDGSAPDRTKTLYEKPVPITPPVTLKAIAVKAGLEDSDVLEVRYTVIQPAAAPEADPPAGAVALNTAVALTTATEGADIYYTTDGTNPDKTKAETKYTAPVTISAAATIKAIAVKEGWLDSAVLEAAYTIDPAKTPKAVIPAATPATGTAIPYGSTVTLIAGEGTAIYYTLDGSAPDSTKQRYTAAIPITGTLGAKVTLKAIAVKAGADPSDVLSAEYTVQALGAVATPTASPGAGAVSSGDPVTLATTTEGAKIYYTTDGTAPASTSTLYAADTPITINAAATVKAIAVKEGWTDSGVLEAAYTIGLPLTADVTFAVTEDDSSGTEFDIGAWTGGGESANESWTLSAVEKNQVYFAVEKEASQTITGGGDDVAKVTVSTSGTAVDGSTPGDKLAVVTVDTRDLVFDGGTREFTLNVGEEGKTGRTVAVTLNVEPTYETAAGAALFKVEREGGAETLTRLGGDAANFTGFQAAFEWLESRAEASTEYLIRVEQDERSLPNLVVSLNNAANVTLRLRGSKDGPWTLKPFNDNAANTVNIKNFTTYRAFIQIGGDTGNSVGKRTFILGNNITVETGAIRVPTYGKSWVYQIGVYNNATLVLEKGSKLTGHDSRELGGTDRSVIYISGTSTANNTDPLKHGMVRIEGGSITNCFMPDTSSLIYCAILSARIASGTFCLAPSSALTLNGNTNDNVMIAKGSSESFAPTWDLNDYLIDGLSVPAAK
jgi:hypothetical protein